ELGVLEEELVGAVRADLPGVAAEERLVVVGDRAEGSRSGESALAVFVGVLLVAVTNHEELLRTRVQRELRGSELVLEGQREALPLIRAEKSRARVHGVGGRALRLFPRAEEERLVLDDRAAERRAILVAAIRLLADAGEL